GGIESMRSGRSSASTHQLRLVAGGSGALGWPGPKKEKEAEEVGVAAALRFAAGFRQSEGRRCSSAGNALLPTPPGPARVRGIGGDPAQLAQLISSNIQKITQC
ncbi:hypothetical protein EI555_021107, partial [Monodon monoceros]